MRLNQYIAAASGMSRRAADQAIIDGRVLIDNQVAVVGQVVEDNSIISIDGLELTPPKQKTTLIINKPVGYVCSRNGQGSRTIYDLLPLQFQNLKSVGRLDKNSSGLLLVTDDGQLANILTHPSFAKLKVYKVLLNRPLERKDQMKIEAGITLDDGQSKLQLKELHSNTTWEVSMHEGRNRQIRRTFAKLGYNVEALKRLTFGDYTLGDLREGSYRIIE
jgi:23S rRNA pseudouridine2605 synthase